MTPSLILIRHGEVEPAWKSICYGAMDVPLSEFGIQESIRVADQVCREFQPRLVIHSGLRRTEFLASEISKRCLADCGVIEDVRLRERNYGEWQGKTWDEVYASDPEHFHDLIGKPETYRPPHGETTNELQRRMAAWLEQIAATSRDGIRAPIIAITHSGPIAAACGQLLNLHAMEWSPWTIRCLQAVFVDQLCGARPSQCSLSSFQTAPAGERSWADKKCRTVVPNRSAEGHGPKSKRIFPTDKNCEVSHRAFPND